MKERTYLHYFNTPSKTTRENLFYLESVGHYWCDKSFFEDSYYKQNYYLIYVLSGNGYVCSQNEKIPVFPGQLLFMNLSHPYKIYPHKKNPWEILWIYFGGNGVDWYYQSIVGRNRIIINLDETSRIPLLFNDIFNLFEQKDLFAEIRTANIIHAILTDLYIESIKAGSSKVKEVFELQSPVKTIMNFIEQNYFRKITLKELASITFLSPYYLLRLFKKFTGFTPIEYIQKYRIDYSKKLLLEPELTIEQIALNVGFYSHSYFSKTFKKSAGLTPEQFRKAYMRV